MNARLLAVMACTEIWCFDLSLERYDWGGLLPRCAWFGNGPYEGGDTGKIPAIGIDRAGIDSAVRGRACRRPDGRFSGSPGERFNLHSFWRRPDRRVAWNVNDGRRVAL